MKPAVMPCATYSTAKTAKPQCQRSLGSLQIRRTCNKPKLILSADP